jgi:hypothetical protein
MAIVSDSSRRVNADFAQFGTRFPEVFLCFYPERSVSPKSRAEQGIAIVLQNLWGCVFRFRRKGREDRKGRVV